MINENNINAVVQATENYFVLTVILVCFLIGYIVKNYTKLPNNYIPLIMILTGSITNIILAIQCNSPINMNTILAGSFSGLASSGFYDFIAKSLGISSIQEKSLKELEKKNEDNSSKEEIKEKLSEEKESVAEDEVIFKDDTPEVEEFKYDATVQEILDKN